MADNEKTLDDFLKSSSQNTTTETEQQAETSEETNLEDEFAKLTGDNKELMIIPDAVHTDLYYKTDVIPFDKIAEFYSQNL
jgi:hypothetical protein